MFVDRVLIRVKAGRGGDGCVSFRREKYVPRGGPDGGDGGEGGSVILRATDRVSTLVEIGRRVHFFAENGKPGRGKKMAGRRGRSMRIDVPLGTIVRRGGTEEIIADLVKNGEELILARGGRGGKGNVRFATPTNRAPREATPGEPGEEGLYVLELKLLADVGLTGRPNSGKSTLLSRISHARPKTADYPFTTLAPVLGIVPVGEYRSFVVADLPGLIEGAHAGRGLGAEFLRHIERTRILVHLVEMAPLSGPKPAEAYARVRAELELYGHGLAEKPEIVVASKMDVPGARDSFEEFRRALPRREIYSISALTGQGLAKLVGAIARCLESVKLAGPVGGPYNP